MALLVRRPEHKKYVISACAGCGGFLALWLITKSLVAFHMAPEETYLDEILVGILAALFVFALETYHEAERRRIHHAAQLIGQLNHYIRNSLQVILSCSVMPPGPASQEAIRSSVRRIEWVLDKVVKESELFSGADSYLAGEGAVTLNLMDVLLVQPEESSEDPDRSLLPGSPASSPEQSRREHDK